MFLNDPRRCHIWKGGLREHTAFFLCPYDLLYLLNERIISFL